MFFVYSGYVNSDNYDASECSPYTLEAFETVEQVIEFKEQFEEDLSKDDRNIVFKVIEGKYRELVPREKVLSWQFK